MGRNTLSSSIRGASYELYVAHYYIDQGYDLFFPISHDSPADFVMSNADGCERVQVKKATWKGGKGGGLQYLRCNIHPRGKRNYLATTVDRYVFVDDDFRAWSFPFANLSGLHSITLDRRGQAKTKGRPPAINAKQYRII